MRRSRSCRRSDPAATHDRRRVTGRRRQLYVLTEHGPTSNVPRHRGPAFYVVARYGGMFRSISSDLRRRARSAMRRRRTGVLPASAASRLACSARARAGLSAGSWPISATRAPTVAASASDLGPACRSLRGWLLERTAARRSSSTRSWPGSAACASSTRSARHLREPDHAPASRRRPLHGKGRPRDAYSAVSPGSSREAARRECWPSFVASLSPARQSCCNGPADGDAETRAAYRWSRTVSCVDGHDRLGLAVCATSTGSPRCRCRQRALIDELHAPSISRRRPGAVPGPALTGDRHGNRVLQGAHHRLPPQSRGRHHRDRLLKRRARGAESRRSRVRDGRGVRPAA